MADVSARSSAKSGSSKRETKVHRIPRGRSEVVSHITQPMATRKKIREKFLLQSIGIPKRFQILVKRSASTKDEAVASAFSSST